jgi:hypothetical protein
VRGLFSPPSSTKQALFSPPSADRQRPGHECVAAATGAATSSLAAALTAATGLNAAAPSGDGAAAAVTSSGPDSTTLAAAAMRPAPFTAPAASSRRAPSGGAAATDAGAGVGASSHHRVVRRLDQHEAWGTATAAGAVGAGVLPALGGSPAAAAAGRGAGADLVSPPKRARVPLFCNGPARSSSAAAGSSPPRPVGVRLEFDGLGPGRASAGAAGGGTAPALSAGAAPSLSGRSYEPSRLNPASSARPAAVGAGACSTAVSGRPSPRRPASWRVPPASALVTSPPRCRAPPPPGGATPVPCTPQDAAAAPATPQHASVPDGQQSTSATPTTPSFRPPGAGGADGASPSDYVTPQQRLRMALPTAPLHRDCLLSAAASAAARLAAAPDPDGPGTVSSKNPAAPAPGAAPGAGGAGRPAAPLPAALLRSAALQQGVSPTDARVAESSPMSESPSAPLGASPCAVPSPSWGPGMIAMLRGLQRTPLAVRRPLDGAALATAAAAEAQQLQPDPADVGLAATAAAAAAPPCEQPPCMLFAPMAVEQLPLSTPCGMMPPASMSAGGIAQLGAAAAAALVQATPGTLQASQLSAATPLLGFAHLPMPHGGAGPARAELVPVTLAGPQGADALLPQRASSGGSDALSDKENAGSGAIAAAVAAAAAEAAAASSVAVLPPATAAAASGFPQAWLHGGAPLTMHLVPVKMQLQPGGGAGAPVHAVLAAGAPKTVSGVSLAHAPAPGAPSPAAAAGGERSSASARSRLHALLEGL